MTDNLYRDLEKLRWTGTNYLPLKFLFVSDDTLC